MYATEKKRERALRPRERERDQLVKPVYALHFVRESASSKREVRKATSSQSRLYERFCIQNSNLTGSQQWLHTSTEIKKNISKKRELTIYHINPLS